MAFYNYQPPLSNLPSWGNPAMPSWGVGSVPAAQMPGRASPSGPVLPFSQRGFSVAQPIPPLPMPTAFSPQNPQPIPVNTPAPVTAQQPPEISPFLNTIYQSIQNIDPKQRMQYLENTAATIKERMSRYEFRIARGLPLTAEAQQQYNSIKAAYNDIQKYINNPAPYDQVFATRASNIQLAARGPTWASQEQASFQMPRAIGASDYQER